MINGEFASINNRNHFFRYLHYAIALLAAYRQEEPFHTYLKKYFSSNKKHGSTDRKQITSLCYNYFRLGKAVSIDDSLEEKILLANFLIENTTSPLLEKLRPEWNENIDCPIIEKAGLVKGKFDIEKIFPFQNELSEEIDFQNYNLSFLQQPKLFIRIRPGYHQRVEQKLKAANISFEKIGDNCLAFVNNEKVTILLEIDKEAVIQDFNSQRVGDFLTSDILSPTSTTSVWDCCAASGGKSILAFDILQNIELTVSDTRKSILENLKSRFAKAGIRKYRAIVADLSINFDKNIFDKTTLFDFIIADVPCTGSGTWARTPDQLNFFSKKSIQKYA
ncbi:MAG: Fmu (Sun) domain-containing protein, partial [Ginsengibacter sp.]